MNKYEYNSVLYLIAKPLFLGFGFKIMLNIAGPYLWLSIIIGTIIGLLINFILSRFNKINKCLLSVYSLLMLIIGIGLLTRMISRIYLDQTPIYLIILPLILLIYYTCTKKEDTIFKVSSIIIVVEIILLLIALFALIPEINLNHFIPSYALNMRNLITSSLCFAVISTIPYLLLPKFKGNYNYKTYLLSCFTLLLIGIFIIGVLGYDVSLFYTFPEYTIFKRIHIMGYLENLENILFIIWFIIYFPFLTIAAYNLKKIFKKD